MAGEIPGGFGEIVSTAIEALIPELQQACRDLVQLAGSAGVQPKITSTLRSYGEQVRLYKRYISGNSAYPAAAPGTSAHEFGYAFDMVVTGSDNQQDLGSVWTSWGGVWHPSDNIHFEYPGFTGGYQKAYTSGAGIVSGLAGSYVSGTATIGKLIRDHPDWAPIIEGVFGPVAQIAEYGIDILPDWLINSLSMI